MKSKLQCILTWMLCLALTLSSAMAAESIVIPDEKTAYQNIVATAAVGDTVYLLKTDRTHAELLFWKDGMLKAETVAAGICYAPFYDSAAMLQDAVGKSEAEYAISTIFSDNETLYGLNHVTGLVYTIEVAENELKCTDVVTLQNAAPLRNPSDTDWLYDLHADMGFYSWPLEVIRVGDWMLWCSMDRNARNSSYRILAFNLVTGAVKQAVTPKIRAMSSYKNGKALILGNVSGQPYTLHTYDPVTDEVVYLGDLPAHLKSLRTISYSEELDMIVYQDKTRIMGWMENGDVKQIGFTPTSLSMENALCVGDKLLYCTTDNDGITATALQKDYAPEHSLNILGGTMNKVVSRFSQTWNGIPFYYTDKADHISWEELLTGDDAPDLIYMEAGQGDYIRLMENGYLKDLSSYPQIKSYTDVLYGSYQELVTKDGGIYGVPVNANSYNGWYINKEVMHTMGLNAADIPTDLVSLCEFAVRWNDEWAEKYPHFTLLNNTTEYRLRFLEAMMEEWAEYCLYMGQPVNYDDPVFREMLVTLDKADFTKINAALEQTDPEISEYKQALIWTGCKDVGNFASYMEESSDRIFIPLTLTKDMPYTAAVENVGVWMINANSANADAAAAMLAEQIHVIDNVHAYVLRTDKTEAVPDAYWQSNVEEERQRLEVLLKKVDESVNKETILRQVEEQKLRIEDAMQNVRYVINASAVKQYVEVIAPASVVVTYDYTGAANGHRSEVIQCMEAFAEKQISAEEFITRMNQLK